MLKKQTIERAEKKNTYTGYSSRLLGSALLVERRQPEAADCRQAADWAACPCHCCCCDRHCGPAPALAVTWPLDRVRAAPSRKRHHHRAPTAHCHTYRLVAELSHIGQSVPTSSVCVLCCCIYNLNKSVAKPVFA